MKAALITLSDQHHSDNDDENGEPAGDEW